VIPQEIRLFSATFAHLFQQSLACGFAPLFPNDFQRKSEGISRLVRNEKRRKESGERQGVENRVWGGGRGGNARPTSARRRPATDRVQRINVHKKCGTWNIA
jgi:hypothetical protein